MQARPGRTPSLVGTEGELVSVQIAVEPRLLEELLEALAGISFPINPEIYHAIPGVSSETFVEFPAYTERLSEVHRMLRSFGLGNLEIRVENMLAHIQTN
jgi:hypothetical protein